MNLSEYNTAPTSILLFHPRSGKAMENMGSLEEINFIAEPTAVKLYDEYDEFVRVLKSNGATLNFLEDMLEGDADFKYEAQNNPNLMFMRDSSITLPWAPEVFIPARLALSSRSDEPALAARALNHLGLTSVIEFSDDEYLEGGDVLPVMHDGKRLLIVGFGTRTTQSAAVAMALKLIPKYIDRIIGLKHDPDLLHLDTGFTVLPGNTIFAAGGMFHDGFIIDENKTLMTIDPIQYAEDLGFTIMRTDKQEAILHERCNMVPLGDGNYVAFDMPADLKQDLEQATGISIKVVEGIEIAKATGGVHCLTRPVYL